MSIAEYHSASQMGSFLSTIELLLCCMTCIELFVFELSTHLCMPNIIVFGVVFLCITINY
jgi:hypothetical protein